MNKVLLGDVAEEVRENYKETDGNPAVVGLEHLIPGEIRLKEWSKDTNTTFTKAFHKGQVLFGRRRAYLKKAAVASVDGICSGDITVISAKQDKILPELLPFVIQNDDFFDFAVGKSAGSLSPRVKWSKLKEYEFNLPSLPQQRKLAKLLWSFVDAKEAYEDLIRQTDELVKSQFIEMFGRPGQDDKGWGLNTLGQCCMLNPRNSSECNDDMQVSFVPMTAVSDDGQIDTLDHKAYGEIRKGYTHFAENDVLFAKITPCMENGKGAVAKGLMNGIGAGSTEFHVLRPIPGKSNPYWLYELTMLDGFRDEAKSRMTGTGGQLRVPIGFLDNYPISLPPIETQNSFETIVEQSDKSKFELNEAIKDLDAMYKRIIKDNLG